MKTIIIMLILTVSVIVILSVVSNTTTNPPDGNTIVTDDTNTDPNRIMLTISGEVTRPGTYSVETNAALIDLIETAGGATSNADPLAYYEDINVIAKVNFYIAPKYDQGDVCTMLPIEKVNINSDPQEKLIKINGINTTLSSAIIDYRQENGGFKYLEEILNVKGIGNATYNKLRDYITLHA